MGAHISGRDSICMYPNLHGFWTVFHWCRRKGRCREPRGRSGIHVRNAVRLTINADPSHSAFPRVLCAENRTKAFAPPPPVFPPHPFSTLSPRWRNEIDYTDERCRNYSPRTKRGGNREILYTNCEIREMATGWFSWPSELDRGRVIARNLISPREKPIRKDDKKAIERQLEFVRVSLYDFLKMQLQLFLLLPTLCPRRIFQFFFSGNFYRGDASLEQRQISQWKKM